MSVVGVDLGLQNSVIAAAGRGGVDVILNGNSNRLNPTMIGFDQSRKMGEDAASGASSNFRNTIVNMKRLIGLSFNDPYAQKEMELVPFKCVPIKHASGGPDSIGVQVTLNGQDNIVPIEAVAGMMIKHLGMIAAKKAASASTTNNDSKKGDKSIIDSCFPKDWVITIPSYFTDPQRRALLSGCEIVGITGVRRLMHENTATALAYGIFKDLKKEFTKDKPTNVMFLDIGASAYTVSIAAFEPGKLIVKSSFFDPDLGGRDFDEVIAQWIAKNFEEKFKGKLSAKPMTKPKVRLKLLKEAEKAKKTLSPHGVKEARINLECLMDDLDFSSSLKAKEYEALCQPLIARLRKPIEMALEEAKLKPSDLASAEIVGGSTRIGCVKRELINILGMSLSTTMNADEAVARGAALQSAILSPRFKVLPYEIQEAQPFPIKICWDEQTDNNKQQGVEVDGDADGTGMPTNSVVMFDRNLNFPIVRRVTLRRAGEFSVTSSYDESSLQYGLFKDTPRQISSFQIKSQPGDLKKVRVNVKQDIHGIIHLSSAQMVEEIEEEEESIEVEMKEGGGEGVEQKQEKKKKIKKTNLEFSTSRILDWTQAEINGYFEKEVAMANVDRIVKETSDMRNELESYIYDMRDKITLESELAKYGTEEEKSTFLAKQETMENWLYEDGFDATKSVYAEKLAELKKFGGPIEYRQVETQNRPNAVRSLQDNLERFKAWVLESQTNEIYAHITDEERQQCLNKCDEVSGWMYEMLDKQGGLPLHANPVLTVADINTKNREVTNVCSPIRNKPAPKKKKEETKQDNGEAAKNNASTAENGAAKENGAASDGPAPMEGVETGAGTKAENNVQDMEVE